MNTRSAILIVSAAMVANIAGAATYIVPGDDELIAAAKAIVCGTVVATYAQRGATGMIETVNIVAVDESLKGANDARMIHVVLPGGAFGGERLTVSGVPQFSSGERVLLFLDRNQRGEWTTIAFGIGAFRSTRGSDGRDLLLRGAEEEIYGWTRDGERHVERARNGEAFLDYVRATLCGEAASPNYFVTQHAVPPLTTSVATFTSGSYALRSGTQPYLPIRRTTDTLRSAWRISGQENDLDVAAAVDAAIATWSGASSLVRYSRSGSPASGNTVAQDGESRVIANDPNDVLQGSCCGLVVLGITYHYEGADFPFNGEMFRSITEADIVINDGMTAANWGQEKLNDVVIHEFGHSLGIRHANKDDVEGPCGPPRDCCAYTNEGGHCIAIMATSTLAGVSGLQSWDRDALGCLYAAVCSFDRTCQPPEIFEQPVNRSMYAGGSSRLQVEVSGTPPLTPQWYAGLPGDTSQPVEPGVWEPSVRPDVTTTYWLRVTGQCGATADSNPVIVNVEPCPALKILNVAALNVSSTEVTLSADVFSPAPFPRIRWFRGDTPGQGGTPIGTGQQVNATIAGRTAFWARAESSCGNTAISDLVFAAPCGLPSIVTQPADQTIAIGSSATLSVVLAGSGGSVIWYRGMAPDKSNPVGADTAITVGPLDTTAHYWAAVTNTCGETVSRTATITPVVPIRRRSARH